MKDKIRKIIKESINIMFESSEPEDDKSIWDKHGDKLPSIFQRTIYRLPTPDELKEVDSFNLDSKDVLDGFLYTIVGRGMMDGKNKGLIIKSIEMLLNLYPENEQYKVAFDDAKKIEVRFF